MSWHVYNGGGCLLTMFIILAVCFFMSLFIGVISFLSPVLMPLCMVMLIMWLLSRRE